MTIMMLTETYIKGLNLMGIHIDDDDFSPSEDFKGTNDDVDDDEDFPLSGEFCGNINVHENDDFIPIKEFHGKSSGIGEDGDYCHIKFDIPLSDDIGNENDDGPRNEDQVLGLSCVTIQCVGHFLLRVIFHEVIFNN